MRYLLLDMAEIVPFLSGATQIIFTLIVITFDSYYSFLIWKSVLKWYFTTGRLPR